MGKFVSQNNLSYFWQKIKTLLSGKADKSEIPTNTVKYSSQSLTDAQKTQVRNNIGAGTSNFSGDYNSLTNKPTIPDTSNLVTTNTQQTITGKKTFSEKGLTVSGRPIGSGDDEGIVVNRAANGYAGLCLGTPSGERSVMYLLPTTASGTRAVWRYNNGSASYNVYHPAKEGTIALTSDIPTNTNQLTNGAGFITSSSLGTQATFSLSGTTLTITPK